MTKHSKSKNILKGFLLLILLLISVIVILPIIYKDDIVKLIKEQSDEYLNADIVFKDLGISLLSTFPSMTLEVDDLTISGKDIFKDIKLVDLNKLIIKLDLWKILIDDEYEVKSISLDQPKIYVKVLADGTANYDIYKSTDTTLTFDTIEKPSSSPFNLKISSYEIKNAQIIYDDASYATKLKLEKFNHFGNFTMIGDKYLMETQSAAAEFDLSYQDVKYFEKSKIDILFNGEIAFIEEDIKFIITKSSSNINQLNLELNGEILMLENDYEMNLSIVTSDQDFKSLFSVVPGVYKQDFSSVITNGDFDFNCLVNGVYSDSMMPGINMNLSVNNGYFKYPDLKESVDNINIQFNIDFPGGEDMDLLKVNLDNFSLDFLKSSISSKLFATNLLSDPALKSKLNAEINLSDIDKVIPLNEHKISGIISSDLSLEGNLSTLEEERFDQFNATGKLAISDLNYSSSSLDYNIDLKKLDFEFHPQKLALNELLLYVGESDFSMNGEFYNYIAFALKDEKLEGSFTIKSKLINIDQLYVNTDYDSSEVALQDTIKDPNETDEVFSVPENMDFTLSTYIEQLIYDSLSIEDVKGELIIRNSKVNFKDISMDFLDGLFKMNGVYIAISKNRAKMKLNMDLLGISFDEAYLYFNSVKKYAPAVKYFDGNFSTSLYMTLVLDSDYFPVYEEISADGKLNSRNVTLLDNPTFKKIDKLDKKILEKNNKIKDLNLSYQIKNGLFSIEKTPIKFKDFNATVYGSTSNKQDLDYTIETEIPFSFLKNSMDGLSSLVPNLKNSNIPISIKIGGTVLSPSFATSLNLQKVDLKETMISVVKEKIEDFKNTALIEAQKKADQIIKEAEIKAKTIREQSIKFALKIEEQAKKQNKIAKAEINKQVTKIKNDAINQAKLLEAQAKSSILKLAAKKTGEKLKIKADEKAEKLRVSLIKKADQAEKETQLKANKIRKEGDDKADLIEIKSKEKAKKLIEAAKNK